MATHDSEVRRMVNAGLSYHEVAAQIGITSGQVDHALRRTRKVEGREERLPKVTKSNDAYTVTSGDRAISVSEAKLRLLKEYYCDIKMTINQVCRKLDIPRRDFNVIKTAFGITKDDVPFLDTEVLTQDSETLASTTLERRKDLYFVKLEQKEIEVMRKELNNYRRRDYEIDKIHTIITDHMVDFVREYRGPGPKITAKYSEHGYLLEVAIVDLHLGKLGWSQEVGASYDYKIAKKRFESVIDDIVARIGDKPIAKVLFIVGSDFFQFDTIQVTTTAGTPQDADLRWHKLFAVGTQMLVEAIDRLSVYAPVDVLGVPGNHDKQTAYYALMYLAAWYRDSDAVDISSDLKTRKYYEWGKNLIGFTHGDKEGKRIFGLMPVEMPVAWGRTKYHEVHIGHLHHERTVEQHGIVVRNLSSITGTDSWHFESGYIGALQKAQSFLWDKDRGLYEIWHTNIGGM